MRNLASIGKVVAAAVMLLLASWMWSHLPTKMETWGPIPVNGVVGERISGRNLAVTVGEVRLGREAAFTNDGVPVHMPTSGVWMAIGLEYQPLLTNESPAFSLRADGKLFEAPLTEFGFNLSPGLEEHNVVAFELPGIPSTAELLVNNKTPDRYGNPMQAPLDSQIVVPIPVPGHAEAVVDLNQVAKG